MMSAGKRRIEELGELLRRHGLARDEQRRLEDALDLGESSPHLLVSQARVARRSTSVGSSGVIDYSSRSALRGKFALGSGPSGSSEASAKSGAPFECHVDRCVRLGLRDRHELLARELEHREERDDEVRHVGVRRRRAP